MQILCFERSITAIHSAYNFSTHYLKILVLQVSGKNLAIIGLNRVGIEVAIRMQAFGMRIIGYDPLISQEVRLSPSLANDGL